MLDPKINTGDKFADAANLARSRGTSGFVSPDELITALDEVVAQQGGEIEANESSLDKLTGHIVNAMDRNRRGRDDSGVTAEITDAGWANMGKYSPAEKQSILDSKMPIIYMQVTGTRVRTAISWIKDILLGTHDVFDIVGNDVPELPETMQDRIKQATEALVILDQDKPQPQEPAPAPGGKAPQSEMVKAQLTLIEQLENDRALEDALREQIELQSNHELSKLMRVTRKSLLEGGWEKALDSFITDFCINPASFMKGPVIQSENKLAWENGDVVEEKDFVFRNIRVAPYDMYPDVTTGSLQKGDLCEHLRIKPEDLYAMTETKSSAYKNKEILEMLESGTTGGIPWFNTDIETDKAEIENKGDADTANYNVYHGIHYWGAVDAKTLVDFGLTDKELLDAHPMKHFQIEAICVNGRTIKCKLNRHRKGARPYYSASFHEIPGSVWGHGIPFLMRDIQKMCNSTARSLVVNMGFSAGPQVEIYVDRLADAGDISDVVPLKIWQMKPSATGQEGRAINFFTVPSVARELLAVYDAFESKADDATGIPRLHKKSSGTGGGTAFGMATLLETSNKSVKESIRHIDFGLIVPRVEQEVYWRLVRDSNLKYTGDMNVIARGSQTLIALGAREMKRREFLQLTTNDFDMSILSKKGRGIMLRSVAADLGYEESVVPNSLILNKEIAKDESNKERQLAALEKQAESGSIGLQATQVQAGAQIEMHKGTLAQQDKKLQVDSYMHEQDLEVKGASLQNDLKVAQTKAASDIQKGSSTDTANKEINRSKLAVDIVKGTA